jgi:hypothetical protein
MSPHRAHTGPPARLGSGLVPAIVAVLNAACDDAASAAAGVGGGRGPPPAMLHGLYVLADALEADPAAALGAARVPPRCASRARLAWRAHPPPSARARRSARCAVTYPVMIHVLFFFALILCASGAEKEVLESAAEVPLLPAGTWSIASGTLRCAITIAQDGTCFVSGLAMQVAGNWTIDLTAPWGAVEADTISGAVIVDTDGVGWPAMARPATVVTATGTRVDIRGLVHGPASAPYAVEDWSLSLAPAAGAAAPGTAMVWTVARNWTSGVRVVSDRLAFTTTMTGAAPIYGDQIPSFLDTDMYMNASASAGFVLPRGWYEFGSPNAAQLVVYTPVYARVWSEFTAARGGAAVPAYFSFAKPFADGTAVYASLGGNAVDRRAAPRTPAVGESQQLTWAFTRLEDGARAPEDPFPRLNITLPPALANLSAATQLFALVHNQFMGYIFGNNPASVPCLQVSALLLARSQSRGVRYCIHCICICICIYCDMQPQRRTLRRPAVGSLHIVRRMPRAQEMAFFSWIQGMFDAGNLAHGVAAVQKEVEFFGKVRG